MRTKLALLTLCLALLFWPAAGQTQHSIDLNVTASTTTGAQYNWYRSLTSGGPYTKLNATPTVAPMYSDTTGIGGTKYFYVATAVCVAVGPVNPCPAGISGESTYSNEVSAIFLGNPATPAGLQAVAK